MPLGIKHAVWKTASAERSVCRSQTHGSTQINVDQTVMPINRIPGVMYFVNPGATHCHKPNRSGLVSVLCMTGLRLLSSTSQRRIRASTQTPHNRKRHEYRRGILKRYHEGLISLRSWFDSGSRNQTASGGSSMVE
jgi:hypothetical protein